jgi:hypothetical protein
VIAQQLPQTSRGSQESHLDQGDAAVEMALVLPLLLFLRMGIIEFGRAFNAQIPLSQTAREGFRLALLNTGAILTDQQNDLIDGNIDGTGVPGLGFYAVPLAG